LTARSREVRLAGERFTTPVLIPSLSSKGFPVDSQGFPESNLLAGLALDGLGETLLVSAYDLHVGALTGAAEFLAGTPTGSVMERPRLLVVDSGGYETGQAWESGHVDREDRGVEPYDHGTFTGVLDRLPRDRPVLAVSYDGRDVPPGPYEEQIARARRLFGPRSHLASDVLLKPPSLSPSRHQPRLLTAVAPDLASFDVVGFTEKELGDSLLDRLCTLARLRAVLDDARVHAPIHLFGALDPLLTPLYFSAGAEIFDGLSWLRYLYQDGMAVHPDAGSLLRGEQDDPKRWRDGKRVSLNLGQLTELRRQMERHARTGSTTFEEFGSHAAVLSDTYGSMVARLATGDT
jgi:hypothetical protein